MRRSGFLFFFFLIYAYAHAQTRPERLVFEKMHTSCRIVKSASFLLCSSERMRDGLMSSSEMQVKLQMIPHQLYLLAKKPNSGLEVLWSPLRYAGKMLINTNGFPYISLKLSPNSSLVRKNTHHTVAEIGFRYLSNLIDYYSAFYGERFYNYLEIKDTVWVDGKSCIRLHLDFKDYDYFLYTVKKGENVTSIARDHYLNDFSVLLMNERIIDYDDVKPGQVIRLPNFYSRKFEFYIDRNTWLPLTQMIYDTVGLYEKYELKNFKLNCTFDPAEFSPEYKGYGF